MMVPFVSRVTAVIILLSSVWMPEAAGEEPPGNTLYASPTATPGGDGTWTRPFATIQEGIDAMQPGDTLLLRGGTYHEHSIRLWGMQGSPDAWYTVQSYPGEWAVVDGGHPDDPVGVNVFESSSAAQYGPTYWRFAHFEVTGAGPAYLGQPYEEIQHLRGAGFHFWPGYHMVFEGMYIHDNYGGGGPNGGAGIKFQNADGTAAHDILITHCHLKDNGWPGAASLNLGNIIFFSDYINDPTQVDLETALSRNEICYNLIEGSTTGFKHKNGQWLCRNHVGDDMEGSALGDRIHHNLCIDNTGIGIWVAQDFAQIHHNIVTGSSAGIMAGKPPTGVDREPFHVVIHNNLVVHSAAGGGITSYHGTEPGVSGYQQEPWHPHWYVWNNIVEHGLDGNGRNDVNILFDWSPHAIDMATVHVDCDYFHPRSRADLVINVVDNANDYSVDGYESAGWAGSLYARPIDPGDPLHPSGSAYKIRLDHRLDEGVTMADGGLGGPHPYLEGRTIPAYVGPCPDDACAWVDEVLACAGGVPSGVAEPASAGAAAGVRVCPSVSTGAIRLAFDQPLSCPTKITIRDVNGRLMRRLIAKTGARHVLWDGTDAARVLVPAGTYFVHVAGHGRTRASRVLLMR